MFYKFNAHRAKKPETTETPTDRLAKKMAGRISSFQLGWAAFMNRHANRLSTKRLKAILLLLVLGSGAYCMHLISSSTLPEKAAQLKNIKLADFNPIHLFDNSEKLRRDSVSEHYLDSLESQVKQDSLQNPNIYNR